MSGLNYKGVLFDNYVDDHAQDEEFAYYWTQICQSCLEKHKIPKSMLDNGVGGCICGVDGCENEADYYVDFPVDKVTMTT